MMVEKMVSKKNEDLSLKEKKEKEKEKRIKSMMKEIRLRNKLVYFQKHASNTIRKGTKTKGKDEGIRRKRRS